jgi:hypothetical protein
MANSSVAEYEPIDPNIPMIREEDALIAAEAAVTGDWSKLKADQRVQLYGALCKSMGLNPLTMPFGMFVQNGKTVLYAFKGATDQLRKLHGVDVVSTEQQVQDGLLVTTVKLKDRTGREDMDIGAVPFGAELKGEARANALMKSITKAKRRATLSLVGLGILDESEIDSIPHARRVRLDMSSGEILGDEPTAEEAPRRSPAQRESTPRQATATVTDPERDEARDALRKQAKEYGWSYDTLDAVAVNETGNHLTELNAQGLRNLAITITTNDPADLVAKATAIEAQPLAGMGS